VPRSYGSARRYQAAYSYLSGRSRALARRTRRPPTMQRGLALLDRTTSAPHDAEHNHATCSSSAERRRDRRVPAMLDRTGSIQVEGGAAHAAQARVPRDRPARGGDAAPRHGLRALRHRARSPRRRSSLDDVGRCTDAQRLRRRALMRRSLVAPGSASIALSLNNLGLVLQDSGEFKPALDAFEQALLIRRDIGDMVGLVATLNNLGTIAQDQRDFARAEPGTRPSSTHAASAIACARR
jgi:tetratricopeptide (TPR) repeat protein